MARRKVEQKPVIDRASVTELFGAAKHGDVLALYRLWTLREELQLHEGWALEQLIQSARLGYAEAQFTLGKLILAGKMCFAASSKRAERWFVKAARQGHAEALKALEEVYVSRWGVKPSPEAQKLVEVLGSSGNAGAWARLGFLYDFGFAGLPKDPEAAYQWYRKAAEAGDLDARYHLGNACLRGEGTPKSDAEAVGWFQEAAAFGHKEALYTLGMMYKEGRHGLEQSYADAARCLLKAAEQGYREAQFEMALLYLTGQGVACSKEKAVQWLTEAKKARLSWQDPASNLLHCLTFH